MKKYALTATNNFICRVSDCAYIPADINNYDYVEYLAWLAEGNVPSPYIAPPAQPIRVSPLQFRRGLSSAGLRDAVEVWVLTQSLDTQDAYKYASEFVENDPLIISAAEHFNLTKEQVHELFLNMQTFAL